MWVNRQYYTSLKQHVADVQAYADRTYTDAQREAGRLTDEIAHLHAQLATMRAADDTVIAGLRDARHLAEKQAAVTKAYFDSLRVEVNRLRHENATLLAHLLPGARFLAPQTEHAAFDGPGLSFEDMGDATASAMGMADEHPVESIVGLPRQPAPEL